jgi:hypothetical protein
MRITSALLSLVGGAALACAAAHAVAPDLPKRKPGHWEITTVSSGTGMTTIDACIGADDNIATPVDGTGCSEPKVTPAESEIIVDVVCTTASGKQTMSTVFGGDFGSRYHAVMKMSFDPPLASAAPTMGVTIDGKYIGPDCPRASPTPAPE